MNWKVFWKAYFVFSFFALGLVTDHGFAASQLAAVVIAMLWGYDYSKPDKEDDHG